MVNLNDKFKIIILICFVTVLRLNAQEISQVNLIIIIDNQVVTSGIRLDFTSENKEILSSENYYAGKQINVNKDWFEKKVFLSFNYIGKVNGQYKTYHYNLDLLQAYLLNTRFSIFRIFNLDKPIFRKTFCDSKRDYVVEVENQSFIKEEVKCVDVEKF